MRTTTAKIDVIIMHKRKQRITANQVIETVLITSSVNVLKNTAKHHLLTNVPTSATRKHKRRHGKTVSQMIENVMNIIMNLETNVFMTTAATSDQDQTNVKKNATTRPKRKLVKTVAIPTKTGNVTTNI